MKNLYEYLIQKRTILSGLAALALGTYALGCGTINDIRIPSSTQEFRAGGESDSTATIPEYQKNDYAIINGKLQLKPKRPYGIVTGEAVETTSASLDSVLYKTKPDSTK